MYTSEAIPPSDEKSMRGAGVLHKNKEYITHTTLHHHSSALLTTTFSQQMVILFALFTVIVSFLFYPLSTLKVLVAIMSVLYFVDIFFNIGIVGRSLQSPPEVNPDLSLFDTLLPDDYPVYTILCPLYHEAHVLPGFVEHIAKLDWPTNKLDVQLLLEEDDIESIETARGLNLPSHFRIVIVPNSLPKTKPKACNYGLSHARGEYLVIYDAEDIPDPLQLKKAYAAFRILPDKVKCLQAKLNYYNPTHNVLTRLFTIEYSLWFDLTLPGLQTLGTMIPLGGTSNHFRTRDLKNLKGWDPFNVTEDCDLGVRLFKKGFQTAIIDSVTLEEANSVLSNWIRQRSRWIKGYMQTFLVHMRHPGAFFRNHRKHAFFFQLVVGGKIAFMLINPIMWTLTISYFALYAYVGSAIESLYPGVIFGMALTSLVFGNFLFVFCYMIGVAKRRSWHLMKYVFLQPFYWLAVSTAATVALYQLIIKPHYWEKTHHGIAARQKKVIPQGPPSAGTSIYLAAMMIAYALNFIYNWYLSRTISVSDFGTLTLISTFLYIAQVIFISLSRTVTYHSAFILGKYGVIIKKFWRMVARSSGYIATTCAIVYSAFIPFLAHYFSIPVWPLVSFIPVIAIGVLYSIDTGFLAGHMQFTALAVVVASEAALKMGLTYLAIQSGSLSLIYISLPLSMLISFVAVRTYLLYLPEDKRKIPFKLAYKFPKKFFTSSLVSRLSLLGFMSVDLILAKHYLSPEASGTYALLSLIGKGIFFAGNLPSSFIIPTVGRESGAESTSRSRAGVFITLSIVATLLAALSVGIFGDKLLPYILGERASHVLPYILTYSLGATFFTIATTYIIYFQAKNEHIYSFVGLLATVFHIVALTRWHASVGELVRVFVIAGGFQLGLVISLSFLKPYFAGFKRFGLDLFSLIGPYEAGHVPPEKLKFLIFNWRDTRHAWAGGAEVYIHEIAKEWVASGHKVTVFCGNDGMSPRNEVVHGVQIIRRGGTYTVYLWAFIYYVMRLRGLFDVVIDCENGIPFFTPYYVKIPKFLLIFHVHQRVFRDHLRFPLRQIAQFLEVKLMPRAYRHEKVVTISPSTHDELINLGIVAERKLAVIRPGVQNTSFVAYEKTPYPSFVYIGRLKAYKNVDIAIRAFAYVFANHPTARLTIAGTGETRSLLESLTRRLGIAHVVSFTGRVTDMRKRELLSQSWAALQPSSYEGWGLTVIEANAAGTPVIASNVPGLRDSVVPNITGVLVAKRNDRALSHAMNEIINDSDRREKLSFAARKWAGKFRWETSAHTFINDIYTVLHKRYAEEGWPS